MFILRKSAFSYFLRGSAPVTYPQVAPLIPTFIHNQPTSPIIYHWKYVSSPTNMNIFQTKNQAKTYPIYAQNHYYINSVTVMTYNLKFIKNGWILSSRLNEPYYLKKIRIVR